MPSSDPFANNSHDQIENDLIDPDDREFIAPLNMRTLGANDQEASLNDLDDPLQPRTNSDREPLTGNIQPDTSNSTFSRGYLNQSIGGEDRRANLNTLDETVWQTVSRDLWAVWEKMRLVLWPKHLLGGALNKRSGMDSAERGEESESLAGNVRNLMGQGLNPDMVLQGTMSEGLRNWDLW